MGPIVEALQAGNAPLAEQLSRQWLAQRPADADVLLLLALSLQWQGKLDEATEAFREITALRPDDAMAWGNYATALTTSGDIAGARAAAETAVRLAPQDAERLDQLACLYTIEQRTAEARDVGLRALALAPDLPAVRIHAARACAACRDSRAAGLVERWHGWLPLDGELQCELADVLAQVGELRAALVVLDDMLAREPGLAPARLLRAWCCERVNWVDESEAELQRLERELPATEDKLRAEVERQRAQLALRRNDHATARELLLKVGELGPFDFEHGFMLARASSRLDDPAVAMDALATAHQRQSDYIRGFSPHLFDDDAELPPRSNDRLAAADVASWPTLAAPEAAQSPIFVVGFPRSGTTLIEQMLDAHPQLQSMDEQPFLNELTDELESAGVPVPAGLGRLSQADGDELRKRYFLKTHAKVGRVDGVRIVDKNPLNLMRLPLIRRIFPEARLILVLRHPCDVLVSCYQQNFQSPPLAVACRSFDSLARAYVRAMENWLYHEPLLQPQVFVSRYEDLVSDVETHARRMAAFLGLDDADALLGYREHALGKGYIATPSYTQVIQPINRGKVGHWRRYEDWLRPVWPLLESVAGRLGYGWD